jgi:hypothetical protein
MRSLARRLLRSAVPALAVALSACAANLENVEQTTQGPTSIDVLTARSQAINGRDPSFDEKRIWDDKIELRVDKYLRAHPELERSPRYLELRFWRQISPGASRGEVEMLLDEPQEQTIDPAFMAVLADRHWDDVGRKAKEAWVYYGWVIYFDDAVVVAMVRRVGRFEPHYD